MCVLLQQLLLGQANVITANTNVSYLTNVDKKLEENLLNFQIPLLGGTKSVQGVEKGKLGATAEFEEENQTKEVEEEFSIIDVNKIQIEERIIFKTKDFSKNLVSNNNNNKKTQSQQNMVSKEPEKQRMENGEDEMVFDNKNSPEATVTEQKQKQSAPKELPTKQDISNNSLVIKSAPVQENTLAPGNNTKSFIYGTQTSATSPASPPTINSHINNTTSPPSTDIKNSPRPMGKVSGSTASSGGGGVGANGILFPNLYGIRENVMLPSEDPEREARILYEKTLKEYLVKNSMHEQKQDKVNSTSSSSSSSSLAKDSSASATSSSNASQSSDSAQQQRTLHAVCDVWSQKHCHCTGTLGRLSLSCRNIGILAVPVDLPGDTVLLDLGNNNITKLEANSFFMANNLEELTLADNNLEVLDPLAFYGLSKLKRLNLQNCGLKTLPAFAFQGLTNLVSLNLGSNLLTIINDEDFPKMSNLVVLLLKRNQIMKISAGAFANLTALEILVLDDNLINSLPEGLNKLTHLQEFSATSNRLRWINDTDLPKTLQTLDLRANPISQIMPGALRGMTKLRKLILSDVRFLKTFPDLEGSYSLEILKLDRAGIMEVPGKLCHQTPRLRSLELKTNSIRTIPSLAHCRELRLLDLSSNLIDNLQGRPFQGLKQLHDLLLSYNHIKTIPHDAFQGIAKLQLLDLEGNQISSIHKDAFVGFSSLEDLNLGNNIFPELPANGLQRLLHLKTFNNPKLRNFPSPETFPRIQTLILSYAYHCCPFIPLVAMSASKKPPLVQEAVLFPSDAEFDMSLWNNSMMDIWPQLHNLSKKFGTEMHDIWDNFGQDFTYPGNIPTYMEEYFEEEGAGTGTGTGTGGMQTATGTASTFATSFGGGGLFATIGTEHTPGSIQCLPMPGPFLPCADLFDWWTLRCGVWVVFLLALLGNGTVVFVLIFSRSKMDVPRFLVCNLAAADFFMGVYLGILAIVDASTLGEFRMFAIPWQMSVMCQIGGFLAVLSSELSVYTLAVITLERNYAITHAIHLNKRLSLKQAAYIMVVGWTFALVMAVLPLVGVSDYRKFAVCLPFETTTGIASLTYVIALMFINGCAFLTLMGCYLKMYWAIRGSQAWNTNDSRIAKRMALLVFTDFLCWSPIAFFSITAIFGLQLISLEQAKIFTVFILPLNSCCNPFLYAIMTKQFKKDCVNLCKHFEETRVTRGTGAMARGRGMTAERLPKELPPLLPAVHPPGCRCLRMMPGEMPIWHRMQEKEGSIWSRSWQKLWSWCSCCVTCCERNRPQRLDKRRGRASRGNKNDPYQYPFSEMKQKKQLRASSISSENFCSSRSSSWRNGNVTGPHMTGHAHGHTCSIPMKMMDPNRRRHSTWLITRKTSQDSNLSSSRNDSSASATTASTSTFRLSRSSAGSTTPLPSIITHPNKQHQQHQFSSTLPKPRLVRQEAVQEEEDSSPPRLGVRFLPTIPSAADSSVVMEDGDSGLSPEYTGLYAALQKSHPQQPFTVKAVVISSNNGPSTSTAAAANTSHPSNSSSNCKNDTPQSPQTQTTPLSPPPQLQPPEPQDKPP
ncbi:leucine-rich repeat-containing G-protein coupled receptor 4 isoform X2 [Musca domestica]|uniref:Leucine-rich repeat-containing G-protein coupled receptor 4 isoform X2 n=1 Tax=Musca domestica TaxID=7370 RepID=A0ABM3VIA4_MUSDO|nr:leucine-rich repeat-containing G-protein coupled receptor 4 isoform X2 [Musca domestica]